MTVAAIATIAASECGKGHQQQRTLSWTKPPFACFLLLLDYSLFGDSFLETHFLDSHLLRVALFWTALFWTATSCASWTTTPFSILDRFLGSNRFLWTDDSSLFFGQPPLRSWTAFWTAMRFWTMRFWTAFLDSHPSRKWTWLGQMRAKIVYAAFRLMPKRTGQAIPS